MPDAHKGAPIGTALHELFMEVFALRDALASVMDRAHSLTGLGGSQHRVLHMLEQAGEATVPDIAFRLGVTRQHVQHVCNELLDMGLAVRRNNPRHRRSWLFAMTEAGRRALHTSREAEDAFVEGLQPGAELPAVVAAIDLLRELRRETERLPGHDARE